MELYRYYGCIYCECIVGIIKANSIAEADSLLAKTYEDYDLWENKSLEKVEFDKNNIIEVYYGCY